jgi:hypothetical protein
MEVQVYLFFPYSFMGYAGTTWPYLICTVKGGAYLTLCNSTDKNQSKVFLSTIDLKIYENLSISILCL